MEMAWDNSKHDQMPCSDAQISETIAQCLAAAGNGNIEAYYDLGTAFSTGSEGVPLDLIEAHKWFNIAATCGHEEAALCRADVSDEMTAREIAEAQRRARTWIATMPPRTDRCAA